MYPRRRFTIPLRGGRSLVLGERTLVMGIINVTPDSFSDGGQLLDAKAAIEAGVRMVEEGADLLDIGGESTRPGAQPTPEAEESEQDDGVTVATQQTTWSQFLPREPKYDLATHDEPLPVVSTKDIRKYEREEAAKKKAEKKKKMGKKGKKPLGHGIFTALGMSRKAPSIESFACETATRHDSLHSQSSHGSRKSARPGRRPHESTHSHKRR